MIARFHGELENFEIISTQQTRAAEVMGSPGHVESCCEDVRLSKIFSRIKSNVILFYDSLLFGSFNLTFIFIHVGKISILLWVRNIQPHKRVIFSLTDAHG